MITTSKWHWPLFLCPFVDYFKYVLYFKTALILKNLKPLVRSSPNTKSCMGMKCRPKWCRKHCSKATVSLRLLRLQLFLTLTKNSLVSRLSKVWWLIRLITDLCTNYMYTVFFGLLKMAYFRLVHLFECTVLWKLGPQFEAWVGQSHLKATQALLFFIIRSR